MTDRRSILKASLLAPAMLARPASAATGPAGIQMKLPCVVSTWPFGVAANKAAWTILSLEIDTAPDQKLTTGTSGTSASTISDASSSLWPVTVGAAVLRRAGASAVLPLLLHRRP